MDNEFVVRIDNYDDDTGKLLNGENLAAFKYPQDASDFIRSRTERQVLNTVRIAGMSVVCADINSLHRGEITVGYGNFRTRTVYTLTQDLR